MQQSSHKVIKDWPIYNYFTRTIYGKFANLFWSIKNQPCLKRIANTIIMTNINVRVLRAKRWTR